MPDSSGRRLLAALAGSTTAFTRTPSAESPSLGRRFLSALAGTTDAFTPGASTDQGIDPPHPVTKRLLLRHLAVEMNLPTATPN